MNDIVTNQNTKGQRGRPKDPKKTNLILKSAAKLFMSKGLKDTSMDTVAQKARVSKQTLYSHFKSKDDLFRAVIHRKLETHQFDQQAFAASGNLQKDLHEIGTLYLNLILDDEAIDLCRVVIAEGKKYKKTAQLFYDQGSEKITTVLADFFENQNISDPRFYAVSFLNILEGEWYTQGLIGIRKKPDQKEINAHVGKVVTNFVKMVCSKQR